MADIALIGKKIRSLRKAKNISQEKLAEMIKMNYRTINRIENNQVIPSLDTLNKIANALNINITVLFETETLESREVLLSKINDIARKMEETRLRTFYKAIYQFFI